MPSLNQVQLIGHLGQDPEVRYTQNGTAVANFSVATTDRWKDKNTGDMQERTEWHRIVLWGKQGELAGEYLKKGALVHIEGSLQTREWEDKEGVKRYTTEINARRFLMLDKKGQGSTSSAKSLPDTEADDGIPF